MSHSVFLSLIGEWSIYGGKDDKLHIEYIYTSIKPLEIRMSKRNKAVTICNNWWMHCYHETNKK